MKKGRLLLLSVLSLPIVVLAQLTGSGGRISDPEKNGYVPDATTACAIAEAVLKPIYGEATVRAQQPLKARVGTKGQWIVEGSWPPPGTRIFGGTLMVMISKQDGKIIEAIQWK